MSKHLKGQVDAKCFENPSYRIQREIPYEDVELEKLINQKLFTTWAADLDTDREGDVARRKGLVDQVFTTAAKVLTDVQYQIFSAYFVVGMSELQIASNFDVTQPYVSLVLGACVRKIKKHLGLPPKPPRAAK